MKKRSVPEEKPPAISIHRRFSRTLMTVVAVVLLFFFAGGIWVDIVRQNHRLLERMAYLLKVADTGMGDPLWNVNHAGVISVANALFLDPDIVLLRVSDNYETVISLSRPAWQGRDFDAAETSPDILCKSAVIRFDGQEAGTIHIALSRAGIDRQIETNILVMIGLILVLVTATWITSLIMTRRIISVRILELRRAAALIAVGNLETPITTGPDDEIGQLAAELNHMRSAIRRLFSALRTSHERLREHGRELERQVAERTHELRRELAERREAEKALLLARETAEAANRDKTALLGSISHELRTPLNAILGFSALLLRDPELAPAYRSDIAQIHRGGEHLVTLINDVLDMSAIEDGRLVLVQAPFEVETLLRDVAEIVASRAAERGLRFRVAPWEGPPKRVCQDERRLKQTILNLSTEAIRAMEKGTVTLRVSAEPAPPSGDDPGRRFWLLYVDIAGEAIGGASRETEGWRRGNGVGVGLAVGRRFARLLGGEVREEIGSGQFPHFHFTIEADDVMEPRLTAQPSPAPVPEKTERSRMLIADDNSMNRLLLVRYLEPTGAELREAADGREAVAVWEEFHPHLVWMDMRMPVMGGIEATRRIRELDTGRATVIIGLTASVENDERESLLVAGCDDVMGKPFDAGELFAMMRRYGIGAGLPGSWTEKAARFSSPDDDRPPSPSALDGLPGNVIADICMCAETANLEGLLDIADRLNSSHSAARIALRRMTEVYAYEEILRWCSTARAAGRAPSNGASSGEAA